jgi:four helix bundle protein
MNFHDELKLCMHKYVKFIYRITKKFPKEELYGIVSQIRRAAMSIILNYIEGYARRKKENCKVYNNFLETSYGSLKESKYLLFFSYDETYITQEEYEYGIFLTDKIGKMLWSLIEK